MGTTTNATRGRSIDRRLEPTTWLHGFVVATLGSSLVACAHVAPTEPAAPVNSQLPVATIEPATVPTEVVPVAPRPPNARLAFGVGWSSSCAIDLGGELHCWGLPPTFLEGTDDVVLTRPQHVDGVHDLVDVAMGGRNLCVIDRAGALHCTDLLANDPAASLEHFRRAIPDLPPVRSVTLTHEVGCAIDLEGAVYCWGDGMQVPSEGGSCESDESRGCASTPRRVTGVDRARSVALGRDLACAVLESGGVTCWGGLDRGILGRADDAGRGPIPVPDLSDARSVGIGSHFVCAATASDEVRCWNTVRGSLRASDRAHRFSLAALRGATDLEVEETVVCGRIADFGVRCVEAAPPPPPVRPRRGSRVPIVRAAGTFVPFETRSFRSLLVTEFPGAERIALAHDHACLVDSTGGLRCWGDNGLGAVGDPFSLEARAPIPILAADGSVVSDEVRERDPAYHVFPELPPYTEREVTTIDFDEISLRDLGTPPSPPTTRDVGTIVRARLAQHEAAIRRCFATAPTASFAVRFIFAPGVRGVASVVVELEPGPERACLDAEIRTLEPMRTDAPVVVAMRLAP